MQLTQSIVADHLDMSRQQAAAWLDRLGIDRRVASLDEIRVAYIRELRGQAAARAASGDLDLATARARLAKEQADRVAMQNTITRGELAPVALIEEVLTKAGAKIAGVFDAIPGAVRRRFPALHPDAANLLSGEIARARNVVAAMSLADLSEPQGQDDEYDMLPIEVQGAAAAGEIADHLPALEIDKEGAPE